MLDNEIRIPVEVLQLFSPAEAVEYHLVPSRFDDQSLACYGEEGYDYRNAIEELEVIWGKKLQIAYLPPAHFNRLLRQNYRGEQRDNPSVEIISSSGGTAFLHTLISEAYRNNASDIHIEVYEGRARIRLRIDGKLIERYAVAKNDYASLVNQVKIMAGLDISEKRLPQDGRIYYDREVQKFDLRVSVLPTIYGEKVVMRLLTRQAGLLDLNNLGFSPQQLAAYQAAIGNPHGLVLISGPTGSGKSTTLYATLRLLNNPDSNILTIEDPVEYTLEGVNQVQLKEEIGLTFGGALRTFLRQDPDIIMLGEIRDPDTAQMAIRSSLTGHLIFSTIHTNSAWGSVSRLTDMGVHPYLIADTLLLCAAQRLVRLLCPHCKQLLTPEEMEALPAFLAGSGKRYYRASGCEACYYTGYSGRKAIYEVIPLSGELTEIVRKGDTDISAYLQQHGIRTLCDSATALLEAGLTSVAEVLPLLNGKF